MAAAGAAIIAASAPALAQETVAQFYRGKTVTVLVGTETGGPYDTYARLFARHVGKHIPGAPQIIVNNMPGAGSQTAATYVARIAPKDGTIIAATFASQPLDPILSEVPLGYDYTRVNYLGSAASETSVCLVRGGAPTKTFGEMFSTQVVMGGAAANTASGYHPTILNNLIGTKFKVVLGYPGAANISTAILKGEIDGQCGLGWRAMKMQYGNYLASGEMLPVAQLNEKGHPELDAMGLPLTVNYARSEEARRVLGIVYAQQTFARPYFVAPDTPAERVEALRRAFMDTLKDPALVAEADRMKLEIEPVASATIEDVLKRVYASPPELVKAARAAVSPPK
jgi:tripartite-type tricarboxylate transporter receptor subunit TctC